MKRQDWTKYLKSIEPPVYLDLLERAANSSVPGVFLALLAVKKTLEETGGPSSIMLGWLSGWYVTFNMGEGENIRGNYKKFFPTPDNKIVGYFSTPGIETKSQCDPQKFEMWNKFCKSLPIPNAQEKENLIASFSACVYVFTEKNFISASFEVIFIAQMEGVLEKILLEDNLRAQANIIKGDLPQEEPLNNLRSLGKKI